MRGLVGGRGGEAVSPGPLLLVWTPTVPGPHHCSGGRQNQDSCNECPWGSQWGFALSHILQREPARPPQAIMGPASLLPVRAPGLGPLWPGLPGVEEQVSGPRSPRGGERA